RQHHRHDGGRPGDHHQPHRQRDADAGPQSRRARPAARRSRHHRIGGRGAAALRESEPAYRPHHAARHGARRQGAEEGRRRHGGDGGRQSRPLALSRSRPARPSAYGQSPSRLRLGGAFLLRRAARPHRGPDRLQHAPASPAGRGAGAGQARMARESRPARLEGPARALSASGGSGMSEAVGLSEVKRRLLAQMLDGAVGAQSAAAAAQVPVRAPAARPRLSAEQSHVWLHASMAPDMPLYNEPITIHRRGSFDLAILKRAFAELLRRHEIWRTALVEENGEVRQIVRPALEVDLKLVDLSNRPAAQREAEALKIATRDARQPFDLAAAPLFRVTVLKFSENEHRLHLTLHHIIFDGVSIYRTILPELSEIYDAFAAGRQPDLPEPQLQYGD